MAEAAFNHFTSNLGTAEERPFSIDLASVHTGPFELSGLEEPFFEDEIWRAIKSLHVGRVPEPDGFTSEFLRSAWEIIKHDIYDVFVKLYYLNGQGFHKLNEALTKTIIVKVNQIIRGFLWIGHKDVQGGQCRVRGARVCRPTYLGGLGIQDLQRSVIALCN